MIIQNNCYQQGFGDKRAPHDIDLYSIRADGGNSIKLTNLHAYEFSDLNPNHRGDTLFCKLIIKGVEGIYLVSLSDTTKTKIKAVYAVVGVLIFNNLLL